MSKKIAFLSGKGGSGKTTIALTIATMLSSCKISVLLVDCDLVTNGATYFYEDRLKDNILSFYDIIYKKDENSINSGNPIEIIPSFYHFIPSIQKATVDYHIFADSDESINDRFNYLCEVWDNTYDVILFDCSAGYTDVLRYVVPKTNVNLVVLEADTVSMASMRSLYLKIGNFLINKQFYQIFNKIQPEKVGEYKKIDGTFFKNIGAISFDWSICDAFSVADVPTIDNASIEFGNQLNKICTVLFSGARFQNKLMRYSLALSLRKARIEQAETEDSLLIYQRSYKKNSFSKIIMILICSAVPLVAMLLPFSSSVNNLFNTETRLFSGILLFVYGIIIITFELMTIKDGKEKKIMLNTYSRRIERLNKEIQDLERELEKVDLK